MQTVAIEGKKREELGTKYSRAIRKENQVPCVVYGGNEVLHFHAHKNAFSKLVYTPDFKIAEIDVEGKKVRAILKDIQFHPVTDALQHIDFIELVGGKKVKAEVPLRMQGVAPGVKLGGKLQQSIRKVKIMATPEQLVDHVTVDISMLELGQSVRVRDIATPEGLEVLNPPAIPVAMVEIPRALRSAMTEKAKEDAKAGN